MAPDHPLNSGPFWLETNRHSPRIFNKNTTKLDVSKVNNKIDFMKSLNLCCTKNTKEFYSKINWEILLPKNSLPLKNCSVVISNIKCDICQQSLKSQIDVENHKKSNCRLIKEDKSNYKKKYNIIEEPITKNKHEKENVHKNSIKCNNSSNNNNLFKTDNKIGLCKKNTYRKKSKDRVTKLTLKIGSEVISKVYCKTKYLNETVSENKKASPDYHHENCENDNETENIVHNSKIDLEVAHVNSSNTEHTKSNVSRLRKLAAALVEHELRRQALRNLEYADTFSEEEEFKDEKCDDDAVVPIVNEKIVNATEDDDIQEVLRITRNVNNLGKTAVACENSRTTKNFEVITIDDEVDDNFQDDCIIVDELLCNQNSLRCEENSYGIHVINDDNFNAGGLQNKNALSYLGKRKSFSHNLMNENILKKQKSTNAINTGFNSEKVDLNEVHIRNCQIPTIKLSQFALPLKWVNF